MVSRSLKQETKYNLETPNLSNNKIDTVLKPIYLPAVHKFVKYLDIILIEFTHEELQQKRKNWKYLTLLYKWHLLFSRWRGKKWIKRLWLQNTITWHNIATLRDTKNWIYALIHPKVK